MEKALSIIEWGTVKEFKEVYPKITHFIDNIIDEDTTLLNHAISCKKLPFVKHFVKSGADIEHRSEKNDTALFESVLVRSIPIAKFLIEQGANIKTKNTLNQGILYAINQMRYGDTTKKKLRMLEFILSLGLDINEKDKLGRTVLFEYVLWDEPEILELLIDNGAEVNTIDNYGYTPLHIAASNGWYKICKILMKKGCNIKSLNNYGWSAWDIAKINNNINNNGELDFLETKINDHMAILSAKLLKSVLDGQEEEALSLITDHQNLNLFDQTGCSLTILAIRGGHFELTKKILQRSGIIIDGALSMATFKSDYKTVKLLLEYGAIPNKDIHNPWSPLCNLLELGGFNEDKLKIAQLLFAAGAIYNPNEIGILYPLKKVVGRINNKKLNQLLGINASN